MENISTLFPTNFNSTTWFIVQGDPGLSLVDAKKMARYVIGFDCTKYLHLRWIIILN